MDEGRAGCSNREWLDGVYGRLLAKMKAECARVGTNIPYTTGEDGRYHDITETPYGRTPDGKPYLGNWTNGFWPGMLWHMYHATGDEAYKAAAVGVEERLEAVLDDPESVGHDLGFMFLQSSGTGRQGGGGCWPRRSWPPDTILTGNSSAPGPAPGTANRGNGWAGATSGAG